MDEKQKAWGESAGTAALALVMSLITEEIERGHLPLASLASIADRAKGMLSPVRNDDLRAGAERLIATLPAALEALRKEEQSD